LCYGINEIKLNEQLDSYGRQCRENSVNTGPDSRQDVLLVTYKHRSGR